MKILEKLKLKSDKMLKQKELVSFRGGSSDCDKECTSGIPCCCSDGTKECSSSLSHCMSFCGL